MINLKKKLQDRQFTLGSWFSAGNPQMMEVMSQCGFEWITLDMEHSVITLDMVPALLLPLKAAGVVPLVRVEENDPNIIKRVMDAGAYGVFVPMVNSADDAQRAVAAVKYPPRGSRGVGLARAQGYGFAFEEYKKWVNRDSVVIVQIEHIEAIDNLEEILTTPGVDGSIIGPYDLSGSLGLPGQFEHPRVKQALKRYEAVCRSLKKPMGFHVVYPDIKKALSYKKRGYTLLAVGLDSLYLGTKCREIVKEIK